jgi:hypothetical protein
MGNCRACWNGQVLGFLIKVCIQARRNEAPHDGEKLWKKRCLASHNYLRPSWHLVSAHTPADCEGQGQSDRMEKDNVKFDCDRRTESNRKGQAIKTPGLTNMDKAFANPPASFPRVGSGNSPGRVINHIILRNQVN